MLGISSTDSVMKKFNVEYWMFVLVYFSSAQKWEKQSLIGQLKNKKLVWSVEKKYVYVKESKQIFNIQYSIFNIQS